MPQARPVGPAPTTTTSKVSTATAFPRRSVSRIERAGECRGIFAACFGHVGTSAAFAADGLRDRASELARVDFRREVLGDADDDGDVGILRRAQDDHGGFPLDAQRVDHGPQLFAVHAGNLRGQNLRALDVASAAFEARDFRPRELFLHLFDLPFERAFFLGEFLLRLLRSLQLPLGASSKPLRR